MHPFITEKSSGIAAICRRHGVRQPAVFGPAVREVDFESRLSDVDFLVEFKTSKRELAKAGQLMKLKGELTHIPQHSVDPIQRRAIENSRNPIRRKKIMCDLEAIQCYKVAKHDWKILLNILQANKSNI